MFFAHMALRPALEELLEPAQRLPLMHRVLKRFFHWVWLSIVLILGSGYWIFLGIFQGHAALYVHLMQGIALVMTALFCFIYFVPFRRLGTALQATAISEAGRQLARIRRIIAVNLMLGLIAAAMGAAGRYWA